MDKCENCTGQESQNNPHRKKIPMASEEDTKLGWTFKYEFLQEILNKSEIFFGLEEVENVLIVLAKEGYVSVG